MFRAKPPMCRLIARLEPEKQEDLILIDRPSRGRELGR
jgi:hypothetical protein